jgi:hypothetical protein
MRPPQSGLVQVGIWKVIPGVCPPPTDQQSIAQTVLALSGIWHTHGTRASVRQLDSFSSDARDKRSLHAMRVSAMVYFSLFEIHEEISVKQTVRLLL